MPQFSHRLPVLAVTLLGLSAAPALAQKLPAINADIAESSISGISSGAFMAVQFATAWSSVIRGVGVIAGGPYYCAQASQSFGIWSSALDSMDAILKATGPCMKGNLPLDVTTYTAKADAFASAGKIDPTSNLATMKVYLFHGYNDAVVAPPVVDTAAAFFAHYMGDANKGNLYYQNTWGAGHSQVITNQAAGSNLNGCPDNALPYMDQCGYDQAGIILRHIYGALNPRNNGTLGGTIVAFDQSTYTSPFSTTTFSMADKGYAYVPADCAGGAGGAGGARCRIHIALHGCKQDVGDIQMRFITYAGYNEWADTNHIVVLYPQTQASNGMGLGPFNPEACWDWWSYVNQDESYVTQEGRQIHSIKAMLDALAQGQPTTPSAPDAVTPAPAGLLVSDVAGTVAALAWTPVNGAKTYRVDRAGADGNFTTVGRVAGPSFGDAGLTPVTAYSWRVAAVVNGVDGPASDAVAATTRALPAPCPNPGTCPLAAN